MNIRLGIHHKAISHNLQIEWEAFETFDSDFQRILSHSPKIIYNPSASPALVRSTENKISLMSSAASKGAEIRNPYFLSAQSFSTN